MRLELTRVGLLAELANHYTTRGALGMIVMHLLYIQLMNIIGYVPFPINTADTAGVLGCLFVWVFWYINSVGYLMPNPLLYKNQFDFKKFSSSQVHSLIVKIFLF